MEAIIFNTQAEAESLVWEINSVFKKLFKGVTTSYTNCRKHPTEDKWCVPVKMKQVTQMQEGFANLLNSLSKTVDNLVELDNTWFQYPEI